MPRADSTGTVWHDELPLLEEVCEFQGRPGGIAGLDYCYCPLAQVMDMTTAEAPLDHPHTGRGLPVDERPLWQWKPASPTTFRVVDTASGKQVDFQILERGKALHGDCPGWYRVRTYVHPDICKTLGWAPARVAEALGHPAPAPQPAQPSQQPSASVKATPAAAAQAR